MNAAVMGAAAAAAARRRRRRERLRKEAVGIVSDKLQNSDAYKQGWKNAEEKYNSLKGFFEKTLNESDVSLRAGQSVLARIFQYKTVGPPGDSDHAKSVTFNSLEKSLSEVFDKATSPNQSAYKKSARELAPNYPDDARELVTELKDSALESAGFKAYKEYAKSFFDGVSHDNFMNSISDAKASSTGFSWKDRQYAHDAYDQLTDRIRLGIDMHL